MSRHVILRPVGLSSGAAARGRWAGAVTRAAARAASGLVASCFFGRPAAAMCMPPGCGDTELTVLSCTPAPSGGGTVLEGTVVLETIRGCDGAPPPPIAAGSPPGARVRYYIPPGVGTCDGTRPGDRVRLVTSTACCDGDPNPPCPWGFAGTARTAPLPVPGKTP